MAEVSKLVVAKAKKSQVARLEKFLRVMFERQSYPDLGKVEPQVVADLIWEAWEMFVERKVGEFKVDVYELKLPPKQGSHRIIINILNDNMPFLVDSITGYLGRLGLRARILIRPIFRVRREGDGKLEDVILMGGPQNDTIQESFMHCEISDSFTKKTIEELKEGIPRILTDVKHAVLDWHQMRAKINDAISTVRPYPGTISPDQVAEVIDFLQWLDSDHFTFLGYREYELERSNGTFIPKETSGSRLGIVTSEENKDLGLFYQGEPISLDAMKFIFQSNSLVVTKTTRLSTVHRPVPLDSITIKRTNEKGEVVGLNQFLGLFTSVAYSSSTRDIPLLRRKVARIVDRAGYSAQSHDGKAMVHILDSLPRDELFQASEEELLSIATKVLFLQERPRFSLFIRRDHFDRYLSCLVYVPKDRFEYALTESIAKILKEELKGTINMTSAQYGGLTFARIHYIVTRDPHQPIDYDVEKIEKRIVQSSYSWKDNLLLHLSEDMGEWEGAKYFQTYANAFNRGYQERFAIPEVITDIHFIEDAYSSGKLGVRIYRTKDMPDTSMKIKLYQIGNPVPLSDVIPILEDMDLRVEGEIPFPTYPENAPITMWIQDFQTSSRGLCPINIKEINDKFLDLFEHVRTGQAESDGFNRLVIRAGLSWRECVIFRALAKYMRQLRTQFSQEYMEQILVKHAQIVELMRDLFIEKFDPKRRKNEKKLQEILSEINTALMQVDNADEDRTLRRYVNLIMAAVRTNYFQEVGDHQSKPYLSFKFESKLIDELPAPRPFYEIFVYSPRFEAVHLRGDKIARGGIRWSDRREDFRTEILGLLKAQMVKNAVIVPSGAKGGFVLKAETDLMSRDEFFAEGIHCYKLMVRALLELTDNLVKGEPVSPHLTKCWDEPDPYLVVAADKGTATFSDFANAISQEKEFWLDDAFASGGSNGYDHKAMGITARGAWESVKRHFWERGVDIQKESVTVVGVGDMAGDVFGNGMLLSQHLKMVAAFNHKNIFIDPNPDPAKSFKERERMFKERLGWDEYNPKVLSKGGAVFERKAKTITLSPEIQAFLKLEQETITPSELIRHLITMPVDLLWFGGIGTFIKSKHENDADVGDRANDALRVNADQLKCKVVGEGANLGVTQLGRIEFARIGGSINTDSIDNSGGVDCSDHEVNIKILLREAVLQGDLSLEERNKLLVKMTDEVAQLVLNTNYDQNLILSLITSMGTRVLDVQSKLMRYLEKTGRLDRTLESLPDDQKILDYQAEQVGLSRPELSILLPYAKNALYDHVIKSDLPDDQAMSFFLYNYFPKEIVGSFKGYVANHPLRREIIATCMVNHVVNHMGASFTEDLQDKYGRDATDAIRAYFIALKVYNLEEIWNEIDKLDHEISSQNQTEVFLKVWGLIRRSTIWFLKNTSREVAFDDVIKQYKPYADELYENLDNSVTGETKDKVDADTVYYQAMGLSEELAHRLAKLEVVASSPDIIEIASQANAKVLHVGRIYYAVATRFGLTWLRNVAAALPSLTTWQRTAINTLVEDLYAYQAKLTRKILDEVLLAGKKSHQIVTTEVDTWARENEDEVAILDQLLNDSRAMLAPDLAMLSVVQREIRMLAE